jgi:peptide deformylase
MARLEILEYPDPRLRTIAAPVTRFDTGLAQLIADLVETMQASQGIGLAATQVNVHLQVVAVDVSQRAEPPLIFINPQIQSREALGLVEEGCLSLPGLYANVKRATQIRIRSVDPTGVRLESELRGLAAVCLQHEMDHLAGILFVDHLSFFKRRRAIKQLSAERHLAATAGMATSARAR